jgi:hypothetical protein
MFFLSTSYIVIIINRWNVHTAATTARNQLEPKAGSRSKIV